MSGLVGLCRRVRNAQCVRRWNTATKGVNFAVAGSVGGMALSGCWSLGTSWRQHKPGDEALMAAWDIVTRAGVVGLVGGLAVDAFGGTAVVGVAGMAFVTKQMFDYHSQVTSKTTK